MYKIKLIGEIGWDIMPFNVQEELNEANGQDIEVTLSSEGGSIFKGVDIFNAFREYKKQFPNSQMILNMGSVVASMGSYTAANEVFDLVTAYDNTSWMIHNPRMFAAGDYNEMEKASDFLKRLAGLMSQEYMKRSGKKNKEIRSMMDKETWLFGQEIIDAGFADELIKSDEIVDKDSAVALADLKYKAVMKKAMAEEIKPDEFEKAVASISAPEIDAAITKKIEESTQPANGGENIKQEEVKMNFDEVKTTFSTELANLEEAGKETGKAEMIANNKAIMEFKNKKEFKNLLFIQERCDEALMNGENLSDLKISVNALMLDPKNQAVIESPGDIDSGIDKTVSGEDAPADAKAKW